MIDKVGATPGGNWQRQLSHIGLGQCKQCRKNAWAAAENIPRRIINNAQTS